MNIGLIKEDIEDVILLISAYSGFPFVVNGMNALKEVVNKRREKNNKYETIVRS